MTARLAIFRRPASLALRVTTLVGVAMTVVFLAFNWVSDQSLRQHFAEMDGDELNVVFNSVVRALREVDSDADKTALQRAVRGHHGVYYYVADANGNTVYAEDIGPDLSRLVAISKPVDHVDNRNLKVWQEGGKSYRGAVVRVEANADHRAYLVAVAADIGIHLVFLKSFERMQIWAVFIVMCIAILVAWLAVQWGHLPIRKTNAEIRKISSSKLDMRLNPKDVPIELEELVISFNDVLGRIEDGFARLANFSADIAHELRTPTTNLTTQTEVALRQSRSTAEYREILYSNLEELNRMSRMISDMLFLAQTENDPRNLHLTDVDLAQLVKGIFEYFEAWAEDREVLLQLYGWAAPIRANREMLLRALSNLLSNAIRYTPRGASVTVRLVQGVSATTVTVENPGDKLPPEVLPRLFDRFYRADPSRQRKGEGAGLGLAIVKSIVEAHGGKVLVTSDDAMTKFQVTLPHIAATIRPASGKL